MIVFYKSLIIESSDKAQQADENDQVSIPLLRYSHVFNVAQVEGIEIKIETQTIDPIQHADDVVKATGATIKHQGTRACYVLTSDEIHMPNADLWTGTTTLTAQEGYYATLLHELAH